MREGRGGRGEEGGKEGGEGRKGEGGGNTHFLPWPSELAMCSGMPVGAANTEELGACLLDWTSTPASFMSRGCIANQIVMGAEITHTHTHTHTHTWTALRACRISGVCVDCASC